MQIVSHNQGLAAIPVPERRGLPLGFNKYGLFLTCGIAMIAYASNQDGLVCVLLIADMNTLKS